jgi:hypothetical protein
MSSQAIYPYIYAKAKSEQNILKHFQKSNLQGAIVAIMRDGCRKNPRRMDRPAP